MCVLGLYRSRAACDPLIPVVVPGMAVAECGRRGDGRVMPGRARRVLRRGMPARSSPAPADERLEAVKYDAQAEVVGVPGAVGGAVGGAGGGSHPDRQRVGAGVEDLL